MARRFVIDIQNEQQASRYKVRLPKAVTRPLLAFVYVAGFSAVSVGAYTGYESPIFENETDASTKRSTALISVDKPSVDQLAAAGLAADAAQIANLAVATNAANLSISMSAKSDLAQAEDTIIAKPQIQSTTQRRGVTDYVVAAGENVQTVAAKFGLSVQTVKWANKLTNDALEPGRSLVLPSVDGVVYTATATDTIDSIAQKYKVDRAKLVSFNDLEISGIKAGMRLVLPGGVLPESERPGYVVARTGRSSGSGYVLYGGSASVGNLYAYGYCTWYAYERRVQLGRPVGSHWGDAVTWAAYARGGGFRVDNVPEVGAVMQNGGGYGHVAVVESIGGDGSVTVSEMNAVGWNKISYRTISASQASSYNFIH